MKFDGVREARTARPWIRRPVATRTEIAGIVFAWTPESRSTPMDEWIEVTW